MTEQLRVLTLCQPWASLVTWGAKPFEFRGKRPPSTILHERIVIHAAKRRIDEHECMTMLRTLRAGGGEAAELCLHADKAIPCIEALLLDEDRCFYGRGVGTAVVGTPRDGLEIARTEFGAEIVDVGELQSNWGWPLTDIRVWLRPIAAAGKQGIWFWPHPNPPKGVLVR